MAEQREWTPRMWQGCDLFAWLRLAWRNKAAVSPRFCYIPCVITCVSTLHTLLRHVQDALFGDRPARTPIKHAPLFILGHWRTGTTLLHELLILDPRHAYPDTLHALNPNHFLLTDGFVRTWMKRLLPSRRPMDNMKAGWDRPQEDEFALCMLGQPSPYLTVAFPNHPPQDQDAYDIRDLKPVEQRRWKEAFTKLLRQITYQRGQKRLVLKSPTHTCRVPTLLEMFPDAKFVHIMRDPYAVYPSTVNLWKSLYETHGLQVPTFAGLEEQVLGTYTRMYSLLEEGKRLIPAGNFHEVKYEDLIADPLGRMRDLYADLGLGGYEEARPAFERYLAENQGYQTNRYPKLSDAEKATITARWGEVIDRYGYRRL
ncbi:MAG: sulfotransferase [Gemmataceae bacterium]|nr:sulfotransferase [Gemmataceae bacterium]